MKCWINLRVFIVTVLGSKVIGHGNHSNHQFDVLFHKSTKSVVDYYS